MHSKASDQPGAGVSELYMLLSSTDRRRIVAELQKSSLRLNEIAKKFDLAATEALRQVHRLTEAGLLEKTNDGRFRATALSTLVLDTVSPIEAISKFREFFRDHDLSVLPVEFRGRLGDMIDCELLRGTVQVFDTVTRNLTDAKKKIDASIEVGYDPILEVMRQRSEEGLRVRWLAQEGALPTVLKSLRSATKKPQIRVVPRLSWHVYLTDLSAAVGFRRLDGAMSYDIAFSGETPSFLRWASDLFDRGWGEAKEWSRPVKD